MTRTKQVVEGIGRSLSRFQEIFDNERSLRKASFEVRFQQTSGHVRVVLTNLEFEEILTDRPINE